MSRSILILLVLFCALVVGCASLSEPVEPLPAGQRIGEPIHNQKIHALGTMLENPEQYLEQTLLVEGKVEAVCQKMGCWMQIKDGGKVARVRWEGGCGGKYSFPKDAAGKTVVVQGSFYAKEIDQKTIDHLKEEAGKDIEIPKKGYELNVTAVLLVNR